MTYPVKARLARVILVVLLVACGDLAGAYENGLAAADSPTTTALEVPTTAEDPGTTLATTREPPETTSPSPTLAGAPEWFDLEKARVTLGGYFQAFDLTDASTYRFRSTFFLRGLEDHSGERDLASEILGEVTEEPRAVRRVFTDPEEIKAELIEIEDRMWARRSGGSWEVITEEAPGELSYFSPYFSYELAAYFAAGTFELGEVSVVAEEEVNGQDVLHLRVVGAPVATDIRPGGDDRDQVGAEIWITSSGLLVSFRHWIDSAEEGEGSEIEWTWDLYDLGAEFEIRPPLP